MIIDFCRHMYRTGTRVLARKKHRKSLKFGDNVIRQISSHKWIHDLLVWNVCFGRVDTVVRAWTAARVVDIMVYPPTGTRGQHDWDGIQTLLSVHVPVLPMGPGITGCDLSGFSNFRVFTVGALRADQNQCS